MGERRRPVEILLVEDNETDVMLAREAFRESLVFNHLHVVDNGEDAVQFLRREGKFLTAPRPDLVLLDLNLPRMSGQEVLAVVKSDEGLKRIPMVVMTSSKSREDIEDVYALHANSFVSKPMELCDFRDVVRTVGHFWLYVAALPEKH